jgi:benzoyl-CoA reductase/2-hydroxyglutaryl-CoA dehydratase subunit BcrC/BadD/HgdB
MTGTTQEPPRDVLYTCSYVPEEIILAAGFRPRRFLPESSTADAAIHPNTCGYVKSLLAAALAPGAVDAAGIIIANSCDAMRRLYDLWSAYVRPVPPLFLDIPKKADADSVAFFASELKGLAAALHTELAGAAIGRESLQAATRACNEIRSLMGQVFTAQRSAPSNVLGTRVFDLVLAGATQARADFAAHIGRFLTDVAGAQRPAKAPRIVLAGSLVNKPHVVAAIEQAGAHVVALDTCMGLRHYAGAVEEDAPDPFFALAKRYLTKPGCARMQGFEERVRWMKTVADEAGADGIVFCSLKFCDPCVYDIPMMSERFRQLGIPLLWLEHDYEWSGLEQLRNRIEAFLELRR